MKTVSVLCAARNSIYKTMEGVEVYDMDRDCRTFEGNTPIVAHPPCRAWSAFCRHQAKPEPGEADLGLWCANVLRQVGGVLEHPAHSRLFDAANLPKPGERCGELWTMEVWQAWWGDSRKKTTWLCFAKVDRDCVVVPYTLRNHEGDKRRWQLMSRHQRSATVEPFARWLVDVARKVS